MSEISIKSVCCTCLSTDRKLSYLYKIQDGINLLYMLLSHDPDAFKEGFYKEVVSLRVCWECSAVIHRIKRFQTQVCDVQKHLTSIADGRNDIKLQPFTRLTKIHNKTPQYQFQSVFPENFIDCGPVKDVKHESDSDDVPLSAFHEENSRQEENDHSNMHLNSNSNMKLGNSNALSGGVMLTVDSNMESDIQNNSKIIPENSDIDPDSSILLNPDTSNAHNNSKIIPENRKPDKIAANSKKKTKMKYRKYFSVTTMSEQDMLKSVEVRRIDLERDAAFKCDSCVLEFKTENEVFVHIQEVHSQKDNTSLCDICNAYIEDLPTHRQSHYYRYSCLLCTHIAYTHTDITRHLKTEHYEVCSGKRKSSKRNRLRLHLEEPKYPCSECNLNFHNKDLRWKHVQKCHREGFQCSSCDKKFAFKNNLERHERIHKGPLPREECPTCRKMIRIDLLKVHSRIHADRQKHTCVECDKHFVSRETYESHLKYAQAHATVQVCRHECGICAKRYRSRAELRDHVNYHHNGQAEHKCPVCNKGLATKRCIRRHVRRAHEGLKESARDKICQQCGKAFRDKKGLIEHERVHTGARPLACRACGRAFRQRAALYAHTRRMHADAV